MTTLKYLNFLFEDFANKNTMINQYGSGYIFEINPEPNIKYPLLFSELPSAKIDESISYEFVIYAIDRLKEDNSNLLDVHNSTFKILSDFRTFLKRNQELSQLLYVEDESTIDFFAHKYSDNTAGCKMDITVKVLNQDLLCDIPLTGFDFGVYVNANTSYTASTGVEYTFSAGTGLTVTNLSNNITYTYTGSTSGGGDTNWNGSIGFASLKRSVGGHIISGEYSTIAGGVANYISTDKSFIGGGASNYCQSTYSTILGGKQNLITDNSVYSSILLGKNNTISNGTYSSILGANNSIQAHSSCIIGNSNTITAENYCSTIIGSGMTSVKANTLHINNVKINRGIYLYPVEVGENLTLENDDYNYIMASSTEAIQITLYSAPLDGYTIKIKDVLGNAGTRNITLLCESLIDDSTTFVIRHDFGCVELTYSLANAKYNVNSYYSG